MTTALDAPPAADTTPRRTVASAPVAAAVVVLLAVVASGALRIWNLTTPSSQLDGDQAVTGIMVDGIRRGDHFPVFFAGQRYNGSLEQWVQAAMYVVLRVPRNAFTLRLTDVAFMAVATVLVYVVGTRVLATRWAAAVAAVMFAFGPYWSFWKGSHSDGAYPSLVVVGLLAFLCALRFAESRPTSWRWAAGFGFFAGAVVWLGQSGVWLLIPAALWGLPAFVRTPRVWAPTLLGGVVGAAPSLVWSVRNGIFAPLDLGLPTMPTTLQQRVHNVIGPLLREFLGVAGANGTPGWPFLLQHLAVAAVGVAFLVAVVRRRHGLLALWNGAADSARRPVDVLLVSVPITAIGFALSKSAWSIGTPRYLFVYTPVLVWLLAAALPTKAGSVRAVTSAALVGVVAITSTVFVLNRASIGLGTPDSDLRAALAYLVRHDDRRVYGDYWTVMPLQYLADDAVQTAPNAPPRDKFPEYTRAVDTSPSFVYVDSVRAAQPAYRAAFAAHGVTFTATTFGTVTVYSDLSVALRPWELGIAPPPTAG